VTNLLRRDQYKFCILDNITQELYGDDGSWHAVGMDRKYVSKECKMFNTKGEALVAADALTQWFLDNGYTEIDFYVLTVKEPTDIWEVVE